MPDDMPAGHKSELEKYVLVYIECAVGVVIYLRATSTEADWFPRPSFTPYCLRYLIAWSSP
jgi:hypothetical protein